MNGKKSGIDVRGKFKIMEKFKNNSVMKIVLLNSR